MITGLATKMNVSLSNGFTLGEQLVEPRLGLVIAHGAVRHLPPRAMSLLCLLAEHPGLLVTREEIIEQLWRGRGVCYSTLIHHVSQVRRSLGDDPHRPQYVETVPHQGYRLICDVVPKNHCGAQPTTAGQPDPAPAGRARHRGAVATFFEELRERRVVRASLLYIVTVWLSLQTAEIVFPALGLPDWALTLLLLLGVLGFPIALVVAWAFQLTPGGLTLDVALAKPEGAVDVRRQRLEMIVIASLLIVVIVLSGRLVMQARAGSATATPAVSTCEVDAAAGPVDRTHGATDVAGAAPGGSTMRR